ncbi:MAG: exodeoxyribonuclease VII large subunit [Candidatus Eremiobacteraeota bacterium]|nr:exodeoxyribonuclease VII large subunit [Candidatus Eremiobacteraeota bacterium]
MLERRPGLEVRARRAAQPVREFTVKSLSAYVRTKLTGDEELRSVSVRGEITNPNVSARGNAMFDLKEGDAVLSCFAYEDDFLRFPRFSQGAAVVATGTLGTREQKSTYQLVVREITLAGLGDVHRTFEERKRRLAAQGFFDASRKRPLPAFPFRVALVSSKRAEGARDFVTRLRDRRPHVRVRWCETSVQGPSAPTEIVGALARAGLLDVDIVVLTRGGGSFEDLFAFSDENVVRAIARCRHPVVSAVGHTVDQQLSDYVADVHAETPSAAAERIGPETREIVARLSDGMRRARQSVQRTTERLGSRLERSVRRSKLDNPELFLVPQHQRLDELEEQLTSGVHRRLERCAARLRDLETRLGRLEPSRRLSDRRLALQAASFRLQEGCRKRLSSADDRYSKIASRLVPSVRAALERKATRLEVTTANLTGKDPEAILQRGYAIVTHRGAIVRDPAAVQTGELVEARVARGTLSARVEERESHGNDVVR